MSGLRLERPVRKRSLIEAAPLLLPVALAGVLWALRDKQASAPVQINVDPVVGLDSSPNIRGQKPRDFIDFEDKLVPKIITPAPESEFVSPFSQSVITSDEVLPWTAAFEKDSQLALNLLKPFSRLINKNIVIVQVADGQNGRHNIEYGHYGNSHTFYLDADGNPVAPVMVNGVFTTEIAINSDYLEYSQFGFEYEGKLVYGIAIANLLHELGHAFQMTEQVKQTSFYQKFIDSFYVNYRSFGTEVASTYYSQGDSSEDFADSFALYISAPEAFKEQRPYRWSYFEWVANGGDPNMFTSTVAEVLIGAN